MKDTSPEIERMFNDGIMRKTPEERLNITSDMFETAKKLVMSSIRQTHPNIDPVELRIQTFMRFYGHEYQPSELARILSWIKKETPKFQTDASR
jgi:hypothetical protein